MNYTLAVIITFNPNIAVLKKNIDSIQNEIKDILIVDNASTNFDQIKKALGDEILVLPQAENVGIASALQKALNFATVNNYRYLLTMDQDSFFDTGTIKYLYNGFFNENTAIVCPSIIDVNSNHNVQIAKDYEEVFTTITSGSLCDVAFLNKVGGFREAMFIDYVDIELCLRLQKQGLKIVRSKRSILNHQLGDGFVKRILGIQFIVTNHSPLRRFYYARNKIFVAKKFFLIFPAYIFKEIGSLLKLILSIALFEKNKVQKLNMILKGVFKGICFN